MSDQDIILSFITKVSNKVIGFIVIPVRRSDADTKKFCESFPYALINNNARIWAGKGKVTLHHKDSLSNMTELSIDCSEEKIRTVGQILSSGKNNIVIFPLKSFCGFGVALRGILKNKSTQHCLH